MKNQGVFVKHYAPGGNKVQKAIFSFRFKVKVTRLLTLVSFERASLVEYEAKYEVSISYGSKVTAYRILVPKSPKLGPEITNRWPPNHLVPNSPACPV